MAAATGGNPADEQQQQQQLHVQKLLQEAGIEDISLLDPASLEALKDYVIQKSNKEEEPAVAIPSSSSCLPETLPAADEQNEEDTARPPLSHVERAGLASHRTLKRFLSDLTDPAGMGSNSVVMAATGGEYDTTATTAGSVSAQKLDPSSLQQQQERMMKLMEHQAQLLLSLYERVEELHDKVDAIHKQDIEAYVWNNYDDDDDDGVFVTRSQQQPQQPSHSTATRRRATAAAAARTTSTASSTHISAPLGMRRRRRAAAVEEPTNDDLHAPDHVNDEPAAHHRRLRHLRRLDHRNIGGDGAGGNHAVRAHPPAPNLWAALFTLLGHVLTLRFLGLDRFYKLAKLFLELRRRQVPNFDVGLLFKVLVMMAILMARMSSSMPGGSNKNGMNNNKNDDDAMLSATELMWIYRFYFLTTIVVVGFIIQSGYATFLYKFFVKHNYPWRVLWNGQDIDVEQAVREAAAQEEAAAAVRVQAAAAAVAAAPHPRHLPPGRQPPPVAGGHENDAVAAAPANDQPGWRQAILAGEIPRVAPEHFGNGPLAMVLETLVLIGSFFLSILPMWTPHAPPPPPPPPQPPQEGEAHETDPPARDNPDHREIPQVRPPADPTEYEEDDE